MKVKKCGAWLLTVIALTAGFSSLSHAATATVKCQVSSTRSKISVDGRGYAPGYYRALVVSGSGVVWAKAFKVPVATELEFDFDSNPADVRAGATFIPATFIKNRFVNGRIYNYNPISKAWSLRAYVNAGCAVK